MRALACILFAMTLLVNADEPPAAVDHILIGAPKLDDGVTAFVKATGIQPQYGGKHPLGGTENALVSLGNGIYVEVIAPRADADEKDGFVSYLRSLKGPTLVGWAVRVTGIDAARARAEKGGFAVSPTRPGSRIKPDGTKLEWTTFGLADFAIATAPFFIEWSAATTHPAKSSPGGCKLVSFELADPKAGDLLRLLDAVGVVDVPVRVAERPHMQLQLRCGEREASFASD